MKSIQLKNFQCFRDSNEIPLHKITIFIGENDSGKSAILRAMEIFFGNKEPPEEYFHKVGDDIQNLCEIQMTFSSIHETDPSFPKQFVVNDEVIIKKFFSLNESHQVTSEIHVIAYEFSQEELNNISSLNANILKEIFSMIKLEYSNAPEAREKLLKFTQDYFESLEKEVGWIPITWNDISSFLPVYEYYNGSSYGNPVQLITNTLKSVYRSHFYDIDENGTESLKPEFKRKMDEIISELNNKIKTELKEKIQEKNKKIKDIFGDFHIDFGSGFQLNSLKADFGQGLRDIDNIGEGSKKRMFLAITEWDKEIRSKNAYKKVIRGYDEPDTSLHYKAQKEMFYTLKNLSEQDEVNVQPILCTHSLSMIDRAPPRILNQVINTNGTSHVIHLKGEEDQEIKEFLDNVSLISGISNGSLFFERCFLIVEGDTENNAVPILYKKATDKSLLEDGVVLVNIEGNGSWRSFLKLLNKNKKDATLFFLDADIQDDGRRCLTSEKFREVGFDSDFITNNVILVGKNEFEDIFSDELLSEYLNKYHQKNDGEIWLKSDIQGLRKDGKFSNKIKDMVGKYQFENEIRNRDFKKPEFGKRIGELITRDEIEKIPEMELLIKKIAGIVE